MAQIKDFDNELTIPTLSDYYLVRKASDGKIYKVNPYNIIASTTDMPINPSAEIWWEYIDSTNATNGTDTFHITCNKKYMRIYFYNVPTGGTNTLRMYFNLDTSNSYSGRRSSGGAADTTFTSIGYIPLDGGGGSAVDKYTVIDIINEETEEKVAYVTNCAVGATGAGTAPSMYEICGKYANTSDKIGSIYFFNAGTGDWGTGTFAVVYGHD